MKKTILCGLAFALLTATPLSMQAQQQRKATIDPTAPQVSYVRKQSVPVEASTGDNGLTSIVKIRKRQTRTSEPEPIQLKEQRASLNNLVGRQQAPLQIGSAELRKARAKAQSRRAPFLPNNNHKHLIVNVIYNSLDSSKEYGIFAIDVVTGELTCLVSDFEGYDNDGFNGGGYIWNGKYHGVYFEQGSRVSWNNPATVLEYNMDDWTLNDTYAVPYHSAMALANATYFNPDGSTTVYGQYWGVDGQGELSVRYCTLDDNGKTTTRFGNPASKHMLAMGITSDGRLFGVAKDGNLYQIDRASAEEKLIGHTGIQDLVDYEGHFWLQAGEIDQRDDTFYWMAEHSSVSWTQLCKVNLATGRATVLIDFGGDVECAGMVIAPQQKQNATPAAPTKLKAEFQPLMSTGTGSFQAPTKSFDGKALAADAQLYYHLFVNDVEQTLSNNQIKPGETVNFNIASTNVQFSAENTIKVTVAASPDGEQSLYASTTAWVGYGIPGAPKNVAMTFDEQTNTATITWDAPDKGDNAGVKGGVVGVVNYFVYRTVDGKRTGDIHNGFPLSDETRQITYTLTDNDHKSSMSELSFEVEAWPSPIGFPLQNLASEAASTSSMYIGIGKQVPYFVDIANDYYNVPQSEFTVIDGNNDGHVWKFYEPHLSMGNMLSGAVVCPNYSTTTNLDDWLITPGIVLQAGKTYHFRSNMHGPSTTSPWIEHIEVKAGTSKSAASMTVPVIIATPVVDYCVIEGDFTVPEDGNYFFGLHAVSAPNQWEIAVFDIYVGESTTPEPDEQAPAAGKIAATPVYGVKEITTDNGNTLYVGQADIKITLPKTKQNGRALANDELLNVTVQMNDGTTTKTFATYTGMTKGTVIELKADSLPSGTYIFTAQTSFEKDGTTHSGTAFATSAYVGWDNAVAPITGAKLVQVNDKLVIRIPEGEQLEGAHGAYLPHIAYQAYGGDKAATISRALASGYTEVFNQIPADVESETNEFEIPDFDPQEGQQYNRGIYVVAVSVDADGNSIFSDLCALRHVVGQPLDAPVMETGEQSFIIDATLDPKLYENWTYYMNRGAVICGIQPLDDQFGYDVGKSWNVYSAFNGDVTAVFAKVGISTLANPVLSFDLILEDTETSMSLVLNGPDEHQTILPMTVQDGMQHISISLDDYKSWGWVQPNIVVNYRLASEGEYHDMFFDNFGVYDAQPKNLAILDFEVPTQMKSGEETMANVTIMNMGQQDVNEFTVDLSEDDAIVQRQTVSTPLRAGEIQVVQFRYRANTVSGYDAVGMDEAEKVLVASLTAEGDMVAEDNTAEATLTISVAGGTYNSYPSDVVATQQQGGAAVDLTWSFDFSQATQLVTESFEDYPLWSVGGVKAGAKEGQLGVWKLYDGDNKPTYTWQNFENVAENAAEPQAYQVFSGTVFSSASSFISYDMNALSGQQYLVSMDPADGNYIPLADDYLISPLVRGGTDVEFYYGGLVNAKQSVELLYSETGQDIADFKLLQKMEDAINTEWYLGYAKLPATAKYFAIRHSKGSYLGYGLKIDDVSYSKISAVDHFNIYVDGVAVGTSAEAAFTIGEPMEPGTHKIAVTAVYADGTESVPAYATLDYADGIQEIMASGQHFDVYSVDGKLVRKHTRSLDGLKGTYVVAGKTVIVK